MSWTSTTVHLDAKELAEAEISVRRNSVNPERTFTWIDLGDSHASLDASYNTTPREFADALTQLAQRVDAEVTQWEAEQTPRNTGETPVTDVGDAPETPAVDEWQPRKGEIVHLDGVHTLHCDDVKDATIHGTAEVVRLVDHPGHPPMLTIKGTTTVRYETDVRLADAHPHNTGEGSDAQS